MGFLVNGTGHPTPGYQSYERPPEPDRSERTARTARRTALTISTIADVAAGFLGLWIVLYLLEANGANPFVSFVHSTADWLSGWAQDIFTMDTEFLRIILNFGLPALIYLAVGHGIAARINRA
ncbi:hypothetical protein IAG42_03580 [Streptomyces xanthii]|uniref:Uncharacterized protein n=1 Tax=Streptomyces xanthii TaxID=2768069 RepID=A0A7H1B236_9ACTN|nr:hypothetical protein IAG42_03580 [Streptomyces xanthii]